MTPQSPPAFVAALGAILMTASVGTAAAIAVENDTCATAAGATGGPFGLAADATGTSAPAVECPTPPTSNAEEDAETDPCISSRGIEPNCPYN